VTLTPEQTAHAAWVRDYFLAHRRRYRLPVRPETVDTHRALRAEMSANGRIGTETSDGPEGLESTADRAARLGVSERTIRRRAAKAGRPKVGRQYLFRPEEP
jgi:hypothetical protein